jgi:hypothetical protein
MVLGAQAFSDDVGAALEESAVLEGQDELRARLESLRAEVQDLTQHPVLRDVGQ